MIQNLCLDKGYDNTTGEIACQAGGYVRQIRRIGEEKLDSGEQKTHPGRRWVVERTIAWLQSCRAMLIRYDKKAENYESLIQSSAPCSGTDASTTSTRPTEFLDSSLA